MTGNAGMAAPTRRVCLRSITAGLGAAAMATALAGPTLAAEPGHHACLGRDISAYAAAGAGFGAFVAGVAAGGAGEEIQAHLAGDIPDDVIPNSCNG